MILKIYAIIWAFIAAMAGMLFLTGNFSEMTLVVFGFIGFGMIFMGMIGVLPSTVAHPAPAKEKSVKTAPATKSAAEKDKGLAPVAQVPVH